MRTVVPDPKRDSSSTLPPTFSTLVRTTSMPMPRPEMLVTCFAVEKPGTKINCSASRWVMMLPAPALPIRARSPWPARVRSRFPPRRRSPRSPPTRSGGRRAAAPRPRAGLPALTRSSGGSIPWSTALRTAWVSGSRTASSRLLSSPVSWPSNSIRTCRPQVIAARSRTIRGNLLKMMSHRLHAGLHHTLAQLRRHTVQPARKLGKVLRRPASMRRIWLRVNTSSPTRFIIRFSTSTSMRSVLSCHGQSDASHCSLARAALHRSGLSDESGCPTSRFRGLGYIRSAAVTAPSLHTPPRRAINSSSLSGRTLPFRPCRLNRLQNPAQPIHQLQQPADQLRAHRKLAIAQRSQQALARVRQLLQPAEIRESPSSP